MLIVLAHRLRGFLLEMPLSDARTRLRPDDRTVADVNEDEAGQ